MVNLDPSVKMPGVSHAWRHGVGSEGVSKGALVKPGILGQDHVNPQQPSLRMVLG